MELLAQLQLHCRELSGVVENLSALSQVGSADQDGKSWSPLDSDDGYQAKQAMLSIIHKISSLVCGPPEFLQQLASQVRFGLCLLCYSC
jgi:hypothetical protein